MSFGDLSNMVRFLQENIDEPIPKLYNTCCRMMFEAEIKTLERDIEIVVGDVNLPDKVKQIFMDIRNLFNLLCIFVLGLYKTQNGYYKPTDDVLMHYFNTTRLKFPVNKFIIHIFIRDFYVNMYQNRGKYFIKKRSNEVKTCMIRFISNTKVGEIFGRHWDNGIDIFIMKSKLPTIEE